MSFLLFVLFLAFLSLSPLFIYILIHNIKKRKRSVKTLIKITSLFLLFFVISFYLWKTITNDIFESSYQTVIIKQEIGGELICNSVYAADHHSWMHSINYTYVNNKADTFNLHSGNYDGRYWEENEQVQMYDKFLILPTAYSKSYDRLIIKNIQTKSLNVYDFNPNSIEKDSLWKSQNIQSFVDFSHTKIKIDNIQGDKVQIKYTFPINCKNLEKTENRLITYTILKETGELVMTNIQ